MHKALSIFAAMLFAFGPVAAPAAEPEAASSSIKAAIAKSLPLLQKSAAEYTKHRDCFSCHHQALPLLALTTAQGRGFDVSAEELQKQVQFTADFLAKNRDNYLKGN